MKDEKNMATHDTFIRGSMANVDLAHDFFQAHLEKHLLKRIELSSLRLESSTYIDEAHKELRSDVLYSARIDGKEGYLYLLVEHQSKPDDLMGFRLLQYACRIWQMHIDKKVGGKRSKKLPLILPLVIYNGKISPYNASTKLLDCFNDPKLLREFLFDQFKLIDLTVTSDEELAKHNRVAFMEIIAKHIRLKDLVCALQFLSKKGLIRQIKDINGGKYLLFGLKYILDKGAFHDSEEVAGLLIEEVPERGEEIMAAVQTFAQTLKQRGMEEGMKKNALEIACNLLKMGLKDEDVAKATKLPVSDIVNLH